MDPAWRSSTVLQASITLLYQSPVVGAVGAVIPAARTEDPRADQDFLTHLRIAPADQLAGLRIDRLHEVVGFAVRPHVVQLSGVALHHPDESRLGRMKQQLLSTPLEQHRLVRGIEVPDVVRQFLSVPLQLARLRIERDDGIRVQIVSFALVSVIVGRRVADSPIQRIGLLVVSAGQPAASTTGIARVAGPAIRVVLDRVELPQSIARVRVDRVDLAALRRCRPMSVR